MHFEILVEDQSGRKALDILVPKIIGQNHTFAIHPYKGIGRIPKNLKPGGDPKKRILLAELPRILSGYGKTFAGYPDSYCAAVIVVCDLDDKCLKAFRAELLDILEACEPQPETRFCFAVEEGEAWFLGDIDALKRAYPNVKGNALQRYKQDEVCGTWEILADAVYPGGAEALSRKGYQAVGKEKSVWAETIAPHMNVEKNLSPSFQYFRKKLIVLAGAAMLQGC